MWRRRKRLHGNPIETMAGLIRIADGHHGAGAGKVGDQAAPESPGRHIALVLNIVHAASRGGKRDRRNTHDGGCGDLHSERAWGGRLDHHADHRGRAIPSTVANLISKGISSLEARAWDVGDGGVAVGVCIAPQGFDEIVITINKGNIYLWIVRRGRLADTMQQDATAVRTLGQIVRRAQRIEDMTGSLPVPRAVFSWLVVSWLN